MRRLHVAGSMDTETPEHVALWAHAVVREIVGAHIARGGTVVCQVSPSGSRRRAFDWTILETCQQRLQEGSAQPVVAGRRLVHAVGAALNQRGLSEEEQATIGALTRARAIELEWMPDSWRSWALLRQGQEWAGELLIALGGALGVEQLAEMYSRNQKPVIPLDARLHRLRDGRPVGAELLADRARTRPREFLRDLQDDDPAAALNHIRTDLDRIGRDRSEVEAHARDLAERVTDLIRRLPRPRAFYVRMLDRKSSAFEDVEWFFRNVVDLVVRDRGLERVEVGTDPQRSIWMNQDIFERLHHATLSVVDFTDHRLNCAIELGYALARGQPVILSARRGTSLPFDIDKLHCFFWDRTDDVLSLGRAYGDHWDRNVERRGVVPPENWLG